MLQETLRQQLIAVKDVTVLSDPDDMAAHLVDWRRRHFGTAELVVFPGTVQAVSEVLKLCNARGIRVFPQGGNTSVCGGSVPDAAGGAIVLNLARMNRIRAVDADDESMIVDAGCILANVQAAADAEGCLFPMSLGAEGSCQIGGNIATNAGGTGVVRYGNMRELVLGLEVVTADGRIFDGIRTLRKNNTGVDLKQVFIGSEGTLGIITGAALKLFAKPRSFTTAMLAVRDLESALRIGRTLRRGFSGEVSALELLSGSQVDIVRRHGHAKPPMDTPAPWYLVVEISGAAEEQSYRDTLETLLGPELETEAVVDAIIASNERQRGEIWGMRHNVTECNVKEGMGLTHDIALPLARIRDFVEAVEPLIAEALPGACPVVVGHVGDGNLHYIVMMSHEAFADVPDQDGLRQKIGHIVYDAAIALGGTFSAEHGIGSLHTGDMLRYKRSEELEMMQSLKSAFDPRGILNPGRVLPEWTGKEAPHG
ncbi:MAG: FAD-binding oxidoreductase [Rhodobacteraceae bacterium]|nr:FAD-binding oxidoreductase [Paracoccaceae bacterium]